MANKRKSTSSDSAKKTAAAAGDNRRIKIRIKPEVNSASTIPAVGNVKIGKRKRSDVVKPEKEERKVEARFLLEHVPRHEAKNRWPNRYRANTRIRNKIVQAKCHYLEAVVDGRNYCIGDDVEAKTGEISYICKIMEFFEAIDGSRYFSAQRYYRADDTVIKMCSNLIEKKCIFFSDTMDDKPLECLLNKLKIVHLPQNADVNVEEVKSTCNYYFDKMYLLPFSSFASFPSDTSTNSSESISTISSDVEGLKMGPSDIGEVGEKTLLDLYSGCGAMSTGLCLGADGLGVRLITKWAVDINESACRTFKLNHPETQVINESADDFLQLIKEWAKLCSEFGLTDFNDGPIENVEMNDEEIDDSEESEDVEGGKVFEVDEIVAVCFGDPNEKKEPGLHFKVRWKDYGPEDDTWQPLDSLGSCKEKLKEFVSNGYNTNLLPLPGSVDVICGGPPCQGVSALNRHRNDVDPLQDEKNRQLLVFMDIVDYLRPRHVLMENVLDIITFCEGLLGRYAMGSLVGMGYQARMGLMAAGSYGLPQFRMRVFLWGALPTEILPQYPLPTHQVESMRGTPTEFKLNKVYEKGHDVDLKDPLFLRDALSDLPEVENDEACDEMPYSSEPEKEFQRFIRLRRGEMPGSSIINSIPTEHILYDHQPYHMNEDDHQRACRIPKKKGANFRDLPGVKVDDNNKVYFDPGVPREYLKSGKPLVPNYAMSYRGGISLKPFGRLSWDEIVSTVVTRAEPHNQAILHPCQDRVLTIRENARLQGFPDYYKLVGGIKDRYTQVGNAVAIPVARALGYSLALALKGLPAGEGPLVTLPKEYPMIHDVPEQVVNMI